jgi:DNA-binding transcriptional MerR regulator
MRSKDLGDKGGVSPSTVRSIADSGALGPVPRDRAGQRRFDENHLRKLISILYPKPEPDRTDAER